MVDFSALELLSQKFEREIAEKNLEQANIYFTELSQQVNLIEDFREYSPDQIRWFNELSQNIHSQVAILEVQAHQLAEQIKPFNKPISGY